VKLFLADFIVNVAEKEIFISAIRNEIAHEIIIDNVIRVLDYETSKNLIVRSIMFPQRSVCVFTRTSSDGKTQIILTDRR
jgi:hypothetical protein